MTFKEKMTEMKGGSVAQRIAEAVERKSAAGEISCADAERVALDLKEHMDEVGRSLDLMGVRIVRCQLGLFGFGERKKAVTAAEAVTAELEGAIREALVSGRLPCASAWDIARRLGVPRMAVASACEAMNMKIKPCQLGAF